MHQQAFDNALAGLFKQNGPSVKYITNSYEKVLTETKIHLKFVTPFPTPKHYKCMLYVYIMHIYGETICMYLLHYHSIYSQGIPFWEIPR